MTEALTPQDWQRIDDVFDILSERFGGQECRVEITGDIVLIHVGEDALGMGLVVVRHAKLLDLLQLAGDWKTPRWTSGERKVNIDPPSIPSEKAWPTPTAEQLRDAYERLKKIPSSTGVKLKRLGWLDDMSELPEAEVEKEEKPADPAPSNKIGELKVDCKVDDTVMGRAVSKLVEIRERMRAVNESNGTSSRPFLPVLLPPIWCDPFGKPFKPTKPEGT